MSLTRSTDALDVGYRRFVLRLGPLALTLRARSVLVGLLCLLLIPVLAIVALGLGTYPLSPEAVVRALTGGGSALDRTVVFEWRMSRTLAAIILGGFLALAGALFQTVTRNPLASPDILGLSNGAFTGMLVTLVFFSSSWPLLTTGAVIGGLLTAALIWALAYRGQVQGFRLIVIGIGLAAVLSSANKWMLLQVSLETAIFASAWGAGTLNGVSSAALWGAVLCALPLLILLLFLVPRLRQLGLGEDLATSTGSRPGLVRALALLVGVGLVSVTTAVIGPVAFIALAAPQIARRAARSPDISLVLSACVGALILLVSDVIAQHVLPVTLPVGVVTVSVGGLYLVLTIVREIRRRA